MSTIAYTFEEVSLLSVPRSKPAPLTHSKCAHGMIMASGEAEITFEGWDTEWSISSITINSFTWNEPDIELAEDNPLYKLVVAAMHEQCGYAITDLLKERFGSPRTELQEHGTW